MGLGVGRGRVPDVLLSADARVVLLGDDDVEEEARLDRGSDRARVRVRVTARARVRVRVRVRSRVRVRVRSRVRVRVRVRVTNLADALVGRGRFLLELRVLALLGSHLRPRHHRLHLLLHPLELLELLRAVVLRLG